MSGNGKDKPFAAPKKRISVRRFREERSFWRSRFERAGVLGVGPREFYEKYGEAFLRGDESAKKIWEAEEDKLLSLVTLMTKPAITGQTGRICVYEPAAGFGEATARLMPPTLRSGSEYFASDFNKLAVVKTRERIAALRNLEINNDTSDDWVWRISKANVAYFRDWVNKFRPARLSNKKVTAVIVVIGRICIHLDDHTLATFLKQVGKLADQVLMFEPFSDCFDSHGIRLGTDREIKPGTTYRPLQLHAELLGMELRNSAECMNFRDPYLVGMFRKPGR